MTMSPRTRIKPVPSSSPVSASSPGSGGAPDDLDATVSAAWIAYQARVPAGLFADFLAELERDQATARRRVADLHTQWRDLKCQYDLP